MTNQYHEPPQELSEDTRDFARISASLVEEAEAISWYQQRITATKNPEVEALMLHAQKEEMEHFSIDLEWLSRQLPAWRETLKDILLKEGDILENAEAHEHKNEGA